MARDITEQVRAEEQIRYQARLLENVSDAVISTDDRFQNCDLEPGRGAVVRFASR